MVLMTMLNILLMVSMALQTGNCYYTSYRQERILKPGTCDVILDRLWGRPFNFQPDKVNSIDRCHDRMKHLSECSDVLGLRTEEIMAGFKCNEVIEEDYGVPSMIDPSRRRRSLDSNDDSNEDSDENSDEDSDEDGDENSMSHEHKNKEQNDTQYDPYNDLDEVEYIKMKQTLKSNRPQSGNGRNNNVDNGLFGRVNEYGDTNNTSIGDSDSNSNSASSEEKGQSNKQNNGRNTGLGKRNKRRKNKVRGRSMKPGEERSLLGRSIKHGEERSLLGRSIKHGEERSKLKDDDNSDDNDNYSNGVSSEEFGQYNQEHPGKSFRLGRTRSNTNKGSFDNDDINNKINKYYQNNYRTKRDVDKRERQKMNKGKIAKKYPTKKQKIAKKHKLNNKLNVKKSINKSKFDRRHKKETNKQNNKRNPNKILSRKMKKDKNDKNGNGKGKDKGKPRKGKDKNKHNKNNVKQTSSEGSYIESNPIYEYPEGNYVTSNSNSNNYYDMEDNKYDYWNNYNDYDNSYMHNNYNNWNNYNNNGEDWYNMYDFYSYYNYNYDITKKTNYNLSKFYALDSRTSEKMHLCLLQKDGILNVDKTFDVANIENQINVIKDDQIKGITSIINGVQNCALQSHDMDQEMEVDSFFSCLKNICEDAIKI